MKIVTILSLLLLLASPAFGELTKEDIRTIVKEEVGASEKRMKEYIDLKIETVNARIDALEKSVDSRFDAVNDRFGAVDKTLDRIWWLMIGFVALITAAIAAPQIIIAFKEKGQKDMQTQIDQLREQIEALQNPSS